MLSVEIERLKSSKKIDAFVLATTDTPADDTTAVLGAQLGLTVFRGSEQDVLDRYYKAAQEAGANVVVRVTGDCPMHSGTVVDEVVEHFLQSGADYCIGPTNRPEGFDTEVFTFAALERASREATLPSEREHVTLYIRNHPELFTLAPAWSTGGKDYSALHFSVDTPQDFELAQKVFNEIGEQFSLQELLQLLERKPELLEINKGGTGFEGLHKSLKEDEAWKIAQHLVLGTVELGMTYGLDTDIPQPDKDEAFAILDAAYKAGITSFDTAAAYGSAEKVLGEWIAARDVKDAVKIISKGAGRKDIEESLRRLGLQKLDGYLLHSPSGSVNEIKEARRTGLVGHIGASVYAPSEIQEWFEYVQLPYNALDRRFEKVETAAIFARSPFLQGLLLLEPSHIPAHLSAAKPHLEGFIGVAKKFMLSQLEAALLFALHAHSEHRVVFGVKTLPQLQEILNAAHTSLPKGFLEAVRVLPIPELGVINPALWK